MGLCTSERTLQLFVLLYFTDFLQLGERFRVLSMLERFIATYKASSSLGISPQIQHKMKDVRSLDFFLHNAI